MNIRHLCFFMAIPLYCFAETGKVPARDFKMVDLKNGLTTELLAVGPTSLTIRVERSLDLEKDEVTWFHLIGKLDIKKRGWHWVTDLTIDELHGKITLEIPYDWLSWGNVEKYKSTFQERAWFAIRVPRIFYENRPYAYGIRGMYEEDDEEDDEEYARMYEELRKEFEGEPSNREDELAIKNEGLEVKSKGTHLWFYAVILLGVCIVFYFVQRKTRI